MSFLPAEKCEAVLDSLSFRDEQSLELIYELYYSGFVKQKISEKMDKKFYKLLGRVSPTERNGPMLRKLSQATCDRLAKEKGLNRAVKELSEWQTLQPHLTIGWMNSISQMLETAEAETITQVLPKMTLKMMNERSDAVSLQSINILHRCCIREGEAKYSLSDTERAQVTQTIAKLNIELEIEQTNAALGVAIRRCLEIINGQSQAVKLLSTTQATNLHKFIWPVLDVKRMALRLRMLNRQTRDN